MIGGGGIKALLQQGGGKGLYAGAHHARQATQQPERLSSQARPLKQRSFHSKAYKECRSLRSRAD